MTTQSIRTECPACNGTGLYVGFAEAKGEAVVCVNCSGTGCRTISYKPFGGRKRRNGIEKIRFGSGLIIDNPTKSSWMTYDQFKEKVKGGVH